MTEYTLKMGYPDFLSDLFTTGLITVSDTRSLTDQDIHSGDALLGEYEAVHRLSMPDPIPQFDLRAARWAALHFYRACQFTIYRDVGTETLDQMLEIPLTSAITPETHYSVDLVFQYLPDLAKLASSAAQRDPLLEHLDRWGAAWPLSSVGMPRVDEVSIAPFVSHSGLLTLYVDRVIDRTDISRLVDPLVRDSIQKALGIFPHLNQRLSSALPIPQDPTESL